MLNQQDPEGREHLHQLGTKAGKAAEHDRCIMGHALDRWFQSWSNVSKHNFIGVMIVL